MTPKQYDEAMEEFIKEMLVTIERIEHNGIILRAMVKILLKDFEGQEQQVADTLKTYSINFNDKAKILAEQSEFLEYLISYL